QTRDLARWPPWRLIATGGGRLGDHPHGRIRASPVVPRPPSCDDLLVRVRYLQALLVVAGLVLGLLAYHIQIKNLGPLTTHAHAAAGVLAAWTFLAAGLVVWRRQPRNWLGPLMVATCFALLARQLRYSHSALAFTIFFALGEVGFALIAHSALAY